MVELAFCQVSASCPFVGPNQDAFFEIVDIGSEETERAYIDKRAYCYMLSNHSLPGEVKHVSRHQLLAAPTLLGCLLRTALHVFTDKNVDIST